MSFAKFCLHRATIAVRDVEDNCASRFELVAITLLSELSGAPLLRPDEGARNVRCDFARFKVLFDLSNIIKDEIALGPARVRVPCGKSGSPHLPELRERLDQPQRRALEAAGEDCDAARHEEHADRLLDLAELLIHRAEARMNGPIAAAAMKGRPRLRLNVVN